jgi:topoisomerase-4 subunit A
MSHLFATTDLEKSYRVNMNMIGLNGRPQVKNLKQILTEWLEFRTTTVRKRLQYRLNKVLARLHLVQGLLIAYLTIDEVITIIRDENQPKTVLMTRMGLSDIQAEAILDLKLRTLVKLEEIKIRAEQIELEKERLSLEKILASPRLLNRLIKKEISHEAVKQGDARRSHLVSRNHAQALDAIVLMTNEPLTIILSQKGWIRAAKGSDIDVESLSYRSGDAYLESVKGRTTQPVCIFDSTGRVYTCSSHDLPSARTQGEPLTGRLNPPVGAVFTHLISGETEAWYLLATDTGYGFRVQLHELQTKNKAGKAVISLPEGANVLKPLAIADNNAQLAVVTLQGRLLIFPVAELPALARGKGNKIIQLSAADVVNKTDAVVAMTIFAPENNLKVVSGKRFLTLRAVDIANYTSTRAKRGSHLPRGFQRVDRISVE